MFNKGLLFFLFLLTSVSLQAETIIFRAENNDVEKLVLSILNLVLTKADVDVDLKPRKEQMTDERAISELDAGGINIYWSMTSSDNEERMRAILYPVDKGLLGYRVFLIRRGDQQRFNHIRSLKELSLLKAGQGHNWPDTKILRSSGLNVIATTKYKNLFPMLDGGRFDYFPRGVFEPWSELEAWSQYPLDVEKRIYIKYPTAMYFFVAKRNERLARLIEKGFEIAIKDGSFDAVFYQSKIVSEAISLAKLKDRVEIEIPNPLLPDTANLKRKELWFDPEN